MLSICVPVYNFNVYPLINELSIQAKSIQQPVEIIALDDGSTEEFKKQNKSIANLEYVYYEELDKNVGRSKIRNILRDKARSDYLLFLDCDALIPYKDFIAKYIKEIDQISNKESLICGGRTYPKERPTDSTSLHWVWGNKREAFNAERRKVNPYQSFMTNNFIIPKTVLDRNPFNEELSGYGHEDTLLGYEMQKLNIPIIHIDNPVEHIGLEEASVILEKTHQSIKNLLKIYHLTKKDKKFLEISKLLKTYDKTKRYKINKIIRFFFSIFAKPIEHNLKSCNPSIFLFDLYKLGIICKY
jgi:glycosyltransferase involved in cell wall biosynthesis